MKKVSLLRAQLCFLMLLSFVGACLPHPTANAQERASQESQAQDRDRSTEDAPERKTKKRKVKKEKGDEGPINQDAICLDCEGGGGGGGGTGGGTYTGDGHIWCDGWDRRGDCVFNHVNASISVTFRRQLGSGGYHHQSFLSWFPSETSGFGRFTIADGNVGLISTSPLPGQIALHRWSTRRGFVYSTVFANHGGDYVYGGVAGYVWPAGDSRGFPLYQFYSHEYGHYYTNYKREINCQPRDVFWDDQGEMARVNFPAPFTQAFRSCSTTGLLFPAPCDPFARFRCESRGQFFNPGNCRCSDGLP